MTDFKESNANNEEVSEESKEGEEEAGIWWITVPKLPRWWVRHCEEQQRIGRDWLRRNRGNLTDRQREHVAQRTARKAREQAQAKALNRMQEQED